VAIEVTSGLARFDLTLTLRESAETIDGETHQAVQLGPLARRGNIACSRACHRVVSWRVGGIRCRESSREV